MATDYRKLALKHYPSKCAHCGFGIVEILEVAHIDQNRLNNVLDNLVVLCPNCHKMFDVRLIPADVIRTMRDQPLSVHWSDRMKDAAQKAAEKRKRRAAAKKAAETRRKKAEASAP